MISMRCNARANTVASSTRRSGHEKNCRTPNFTPKAVLLKPSFAGLPRESRAAAPDGRVEPGHDEKRGTASASADRGVDALVVERALERQQFAAEIARRGGH